MAERAVLPAPGIDRTVSPSKIPQRAPLDREAHHTRSQVRRIPSAEFAIHQTRGRASTTPTLRELAKFCLAASAALSLHFPPDPASRPCEMATDGTCTYQFSCPSCSAVLQAVLKQALTSVQCGECYDVFDVQMPSL